LIKLPDQKTRHLILKIEKPFIYFVIMPKMNGAY